MEVAWIVLITFLFPVTVIVMIVIWSKRTRQQVEKEKNESERTVDILEKVVRTKDSIIDKLKF
jgi:preprotein translocase subunit SecG